MAGGAGNKMNYYERLGVYRESTTEEITEAYRRLAWRHHPDQGGEPGAFAELTHARATLTDARLKEQYDKMLKREFSACRCCKGRGCHSRQKGFTQRINTVCGECRGSGVIN